MAGMDITYVILDNGAHTLKYGQPWDKTPRGVTFPIVSANTNYPGQDKVCETALSFEGQQGWKMRFAHKGNTEKDMFTM